MLHRRSSAPSLAARPFILSMACIRLSRGQIIVVDGQIAQSLDQSRHVLITHAGTVGQHLEQMVVIVECLDVDTCLLPHSVGKEPHLHRSRPLRS